MIKFENDRQASLFFANKVVKSISYDDWAMAVTFTDNSVLVIEHQGSFLAVGHEHDWSEKNGKGTEKDRH